MDEEHDAQHIAPKSGTADWWDCFESETPMNATYSESYCLTCWWHAPDDSLCVKAKVHKVDNPTHEVRSVAP